MQESRRAPSRYSFSIKIFDTVVSPGSVVATEGVRISPYLTKTVIGRCEFDGVLHVDISPSGTTNYFTDVYTVNVAANRVFTVSWTEAGDYASIRIENTSTTSGRAIIWLVIQT